MSSNLWQQMKVLKRVASTKSSVKRAKELSHLSNDPSFVKAVRELCLNLVDRHLPLSEECKRKLSKCKRKIKCCAKEGVSSAARKRQIIAAASFLPDLVPHAESFLKSHKKQLKQQQSSSSPSHVDSSSPSSSRHGTRKDNDFDTTF